MSNKLKLFHLIERIPVRWRLTLGHGLWVGLVFIGIGLSVNRLIKDSIFESLDATLLTSAKTIRDAGFSANYSSLRLRNSPFWWSILDEYYDGQHFAVRSFAQLVDLSGNISAKAGNTNVRLPVTPLSLSRAERGTETFESFSTRYASVPHIRQVTLPVMAKGRFTGELIQVGAPIDATMGLLHRVQMMLVVSLLLALGISIFFGYLLTRRAFQPVIAITKAAAKIGIEDLGGRLAVPPANDELRRLIVTYNEMLGRLEDAFTRLRRFAGDVSHELRTPLAVLRGEAEFALRKERSSEDYREALTVISNESCNMSKIVEDLLLLARAQGQSLAIQRRHVMSHDFIEEIVRDLTKNLEAKNLELVVRADPSFQMTVCPSYLALALKNLLLNAIKHSPEGSRIEWVVRSTMMEVEFVVRDYGEGIEPKDLPYLFDAFYRADTARNRKIGGAGIGLSLAQALVNLHGGTISVASPPGEGAVFAIKVPRNIHERDNLVPKKKVRRGTFAKEHALA
jgi:heavy metal sensor kinase